MLKQFSLLGDKKLNYTIVDALQELRADYLTHSPHIPRTIHQQVIDLLREIETLLTPYYPHVVLKDEDEVKKT